MMIFLCPPSFFFSFQYTQQVLRNRAANGPIDPLDTLHHCLGNLINSIVFGKTYEEEDQIWKWLRHLQEEGVKQIGVAGPLNFLPFLR